MTELNLSLQADPADIPRLQSHLERFAAEQQLSAELLFKLNLVLEELVTNAIDYGFTSCEPGQAQIHIQIISDHDRLDISLRDNGQAFDPFSEAPPPDLDTDLELRRVGGLGVHFVRTMMQQFAYRRDGDWNVIEMRLSTVEPQDG